MKMYIIFHITTLLYVHIKTHNREDKKNKAKKNENKIKKNNKKNC